MNKFANQRRFVVRHLIPLLNRFNYTAPVLDIGCGRGEIIRMMACCETGEHWGIDNNVDSLCMAAKVPSNANFALMEITVIPSIGFMANTALLHDAAEHIGVPAFDFAHKILAKNGLLYVTFPPWYSPFGGHQHLTRSWLRFIPWAHLMFPAQVQNAKQLRNPEDVQSVFRNKLTPKQVEGLDGWTILYKRKYLIRPATGKGISAPKWWPDWLSMGVEYVMGREEL